MTSVQLNFSRNFYVLGGILFSIFWVMILISPIMSIFLLFFPTVFFIYSSDFKSILKIWGIYIIGWYFLFMILMLGFDSSIWIGGEYTRPISEYLLSKAPYSDKWYAYMLDSFCFQTVLFLHILSSKLGFPIYLPSIIKGFIGLIKFLFDKKV